MEIRPINRDDVPPELLEQFEKMANEAGFKVICAGDIPGELPPEIQEAMNVLQKRHDDSMMNGTCLDCGANMPNYPPDNDDWEPAEGWTWFTSNDSIIAWQCPDCDAAEQG